MPAARNTFAPHRHVIPRWVLSIFHGLLGRGIGSVMTRRLLPPAILIPLLLGWPGLISNRLTWFSVDLERAFLAGLVVVVLTILIARTAVTLNRLEITGINAREKEKTDAEERERKLIRLLDVIPLGISVMDKDRRITYFNPALQEVSGLTTTELLLPNAFSRVTLIRPDGSIMPPEELASARAMKEQRPVTGVEMGIRHSDGTIKWISASTVPVMISDWRFINVVVDIGPRRSAEAELNLVEGQLRYSQEILREAARTATSADSPINPMYLTATELERALLDGARELAERDQKLRALLDLLPVGVSALNAKGVICYSNQSLSKITGFSPQEMTVGAGFTGSFLRADGSPLPWEESSGVRALRERVRVETAVRLKKAGGEMAWFDTIAVPVTFSDWRVLLVTMDVSGRSVAENEVRNLNVRLEERVIERTHQLQMANAELEAFSYSVSHDLRSPAQAMGAFSQALLEDFGDKLPPAGRKFVRLIREGANQMSSLIDDLLLFARIGRETANNDVVDMEKLAVETFASLRAKKIGGRKIEFQCDPMPTCRGDSAMIRQIWYNLISNAVKYTEKVKGHGSIRIGCEQDAGNDVYYVSDNGVGFNMAYAGKIFGVFQRLHRDDEYTGTGVGLAIVERIVARHGGRVWAQAKENEGAKFRFTIPEEMT